MARGTQRIRSRLAPRYRRIAGFAQDSGIKVIHVDSDGLIEELTGFMLEARLTALYPQGGLWPQPN